MWLTFALFFVQGRNGNSRRRALIGGGKVKAKCRNLSNVYITNLDLPRKTFFVRWNQAKTCQE